MTRIMITGSRVYRDRVTILRALTDALVVASWPVVVVTGGQKRWDPKTDTYYGADYLAAEIAREVGLEVEENEADWEQYGKAAGPIRNRYNINTLDPNGDVVLAFPKGESRGTRGTIEMAQERKVPVWDYETGERRIV